MVKKQYMKFTIDDIKDRALLKELIEKEALRIFQSSAANRGRTYEEIEKTVTQGKVAELFLVESGDYEFSNIKWHDLIDKNGDLIEVKAYSIHNGFDAKFVKEDIKKYKTSSWSKAKWYILFSCNDSQYELVGKKCIRDI